MFLTRLPNVDRPLAVAIGFSSLKSSNLLEIRSDLLMHLLSPLWLVGLVILVYVAYDVGYQRGYRKGVFSVRSGGTTVESENRASTPQ